ncbi:hypothetical protein Nepgr_000631 [Nepenthes gracilis]|uniref:Uncharacterized protein n=1 Tax=Nepenthes gracilis TaxID=150966 RepID=A0AAD3P722_NEPGR|nr:hypothetical protein Nepgr_000631 [Nepenthes gracilis]
MANLEEKRSENLATGTVIGQGKAKTLSHTEGREYEGEAAVCLGILVSSSLPPNRFPISRSIDAWLDHQLHSVAPAGGCSLVGVENLL